MKTGIRVVVNLAAVHEALQDAANDVMIEMIEIDLEAVDIVILSLCPRYRCIFPTVM